VITVIYTTGNGYRCGCCRTEDTDNFDAEDEASAIEECIPIARGSDWDFEIERILGVDDPDATENRIMSAINLAEKEHWVLKKIKSLEDQISKDRKWILDVPAEKARREENIRVKEEELARLRGEEGGRNARL
jgi:hypothetical protein